MTKIGDKVRLTDEWKLEVPNWDLPNGKKYPLWVADVEGEIIDISDSNGCAVLTALFTNKHTNEAIVDKFNPGAFGLEGDLNG
jgi:hypothetical protein